MLEWEKRRPKKPEEEMELWVEASNGVGVLISGIKSRGGII